MKLKIDQAGRIVLPKPIRDRLGLEAGSDLELSESASGVMLTPVRESPSLVQRQGLLMHRGKLPPGFDWSRLVEDHREDRLRELTGR